MTLDIAWSLLESPFLLMGAGIILFIAALVMLEEYRRIFMQDPRAAMSAEVLMAIVSRSGGPGYFAAFALAGAILFIACALFNLVQVLPYFFRS